MGEPEAPQPRKHNAPTRQLSSAHQNMTRGGRGGGRGVVSGSLLDTMLHFCDNKAQQGLKKENHVWYSSGKGNQFFAGTRR